MKDFLSSPGNVRAETATGDFWVLPVFVTVSNESILSMKVEVRSRAITENLPVAVLPQAVILCGLCAAAGQDISSWPGAPRAGGQAGAQSTCPALHLA